MGRAFELLDGDVNVVAEQIGMHEEDDSVGNQELLDLEQEQEQLNNDILAILNVSADSVQ